MFKHSGWVVKILVNSKTQDYPEPIVIGPCSKRSAKRAARKIQQNMTLICRSAEAVSIREHLGGWVERKR